MWGQASWFSAQELMIFCDFEPVHSLLVYIISYEAIQFYAT